MCSECGAAVTAYQPNATTKAIAAWNARAPFAPEPDMNDYVRQVYANGYAELDGEIAVKACNALQAQIAGRSKPTAVAVDVEVAELQAQVARLTEENSRVWQQGYDQHAMMAGMVKNIEPRTSVEVAAAIELTDAQCDDIAERVWPGDSTPPNRQYNRALIRAGCAAASRAVGTRTRPDEIAIGALAYWLFVRDGADELTTTCLPYMQEAERALRAVDDAVYDAAETAPGAEKP